MHTLELSLLLHRALEARVELLTGFLAVPGWQDDHEALHQVRVASRRVRSVLELVRPELYPEHKRLTRRLRRLTRALGLTRELDVHSLQLEALAGDLPGLATGAALDHALELLADQTRKARKGMARELARCSLKGLPDLLKVPSLPDPFLVGALGASAWERLEPLLDNALAPLPGLLEHEDAPAMHEARIRVKGLRYALEVLGGAMAAPPEARLAQLKALQTALGEHHDLATLEALLLDLHQGLCDRRRKSLAAGTLELLAYVGDARLNAFERFRTSARAVPLGPLKGSLRQGFGLPEDAQP